MELLRHLVGVVYQEGGIIAVSVIDQAVCRLDAW